MREIWKQAQKAVQQYLDSDVLYEVDIESVLHRGVTLIGNRKGETRADETTHAYVRAGVNHLGTSVQEGGPFDFERMLSEARDLGLILDNASGDNESFQPEYATGVNQRQLQRVLYGFDELEEIAHEVRERILHEARGQILTETEPEGIPDFDDIMGEALLYVGERTHREAVYNNHGLSVEEETSVLEIVLRMMDREYFLTASDREHLYLQDWLDHLSIDLQIYRAEQEERKLSLPGWSEDSSPRVILSGDVMANWLVTGWNHFTTANGLGERTCFAEREEEIAAECISLADLAMLPEGHGSGYVRFTDAEGHISEELSLIRSGRRTGSLATGNNVRKSSIAQIGASGRTPSLVKSYSIKAVPKNIVLMPGEQSLREMLDHPGEDLLYVYDAFDQFHALNIASGDFHFPCKAAILRDHKVVGIVDRITWEGNSKKLLKSITSVGRALTQQPLVIMETYLMAAPAVQVPYIEITGNKETLE